jgi:tetratricopeptide (TPR) repeat protein
MSRLYIILVFFLFSANLLSQNELNNYLKFAEEQYNKGDYYYAKEYYEKALAIDSNSIQILWKYAETLKAYKDYQNAEIAYKKVFEREEALLYPYSLLNLGLMQKQNGKYEEAIETFKRGKKKYLTDKKSYLYLKSAREVESCLWAKSAVKDSSKVEFIHLSDKINSKDSEFGHTIYDGHFIFSSLRADSIPKDEEVYSTNYSTNLYQSKIVGKTFEPVTRINELFVEKLNTGNGTFSLDGKRFYYSLCNSEGYNYKCKIMVANYSEGKWSTPDSLGSIINEEGANTTMPNIGELDGLETLFFASDRKGTEGGLDIWYSSIKNGNQFSKVKTIKSINSIDNEVTPWWDSINKRLYFSSSWHNGFGGNDILYSNYTNQFENPINAGLPINSPANDIYFFKNADTAYITSNRIGVYSSKNPTCCSDIFAVQPIIKKESKSLKVTKKETLAELNKRLPVTLYFHNDVPDPKSTDTITKVNYISSYLAYRGMLETYKKEYSSGLNNTKAEEAKEDIESFFIEYVDQGVKDLEQFRDLLFEELEKGSKLKLTIKGFASPLAKTNYNVNLTKRRISSLVNYLSEYENGKFLPYIKGTSTNGGKIEFSEVPFGEYTANKLTSDNPNDQKNSIYSRSAGIERKIEILSVNYTDTTNSSEKLEEKAISLTTQKQLIDIGSIKEGEVIEKIFQITNSSKETIELDIPTIPCDCNKIEFEKLRLLPGDKTNVKMTFDSKGYSGKTVKSVYLKVKNQKGELRLVLTSDIVN